MAGICQRPEEFHLFMFVWLPGSAADYLPTSLFVCLLIPLSSPIYFSISLPFYFTSWISLYFHFLVYLSIAAQQINSQLCDCQTFCCLDGELVARGTSKQEYRTHLRTDVMSVRHMNRWSEIESSLRPFLLEGLERYERWWTLSSALISLRALKSKWNQALLYLKVNTK